VVPLCFNKLSSLLLVAFIENLQKRRDFVEGQSSYSVSSNVCFHHLLQIARKYLRSEYEI